MTEAGRQQANVGIAVPIRGWGWGVVGPLFIFFLL